MIKPKNYRFLLIVLLFGCHFGLYAAPKNDSVPESMRFEPVPVDINHTQDTKQNSVLLSRPVTPFNMDLPGNTGFMLVNGSMAGPAGIDHPFSGVSGRPGENPFGTGGLWAGDSRIWEPAALGLQAPNGLWRIEPWYQKADTPMVRLIWERGAYTANFFRLRLQRLLTDSVQISLFAETNSTDSSGMWRYQNVSHQLFLGTFERDSSRIPFSGRNLDVNSSHFIPRVIVGTKFAKLNFFLSSYSNESDGSPQYSVIRDPLDSYEADFVESPYKPAWNESTLGLGALLFRNSLYKLNLEYKHVNSSYTSSGIPAYYPDIPDTVLTQIADTSLSDTLRDSLQTLYEVGDSFKETRQSEIVNVDLASDNALLPGLHFRSEYKFLPDFQNRRGKQEINSPMEEDRQLVYLQWAPKSIAGQTTIQTGVQRNSSALDQQDFTPAISLKQELRLPYLNTMAWWTRQTRFPELWQTHLFRTDRLVFPNQDLQPEERTTGAVQLVTETPFIQLLGGLRKESISSAIVPGWVGSPGDTISDSLAFAFRNIGHAQNLSITGGLSVELGNWLLFVKHTRPVIQQFKNAGSTQNNIPWIPVRSWQGGIRWQNSFVEGRMGVRVQWDWDWIGEQTAWARVEDENLAARVEQPPFLALNFQTTMRILQFQTYVRIQNMNHSLYHTAPGYTPPGINFRYGILWDLQN